MPEFDRVLAPLDFSQLSATVLRYGVELTRTGGKTVILHVLEPLPMHVESAFGSFVNTEGLRKIRENAEKLLQGCTEEYPDHEFILELRQGKPAPLILEAADRHGAGLIVMGTHGRGGLEELFLGSVAARIVRRARCPVLTIREPKGRGSD